ncbi:MAG: NAD-dependent epimerase/dehydratase family protein [Thermoleophilia bacterium]|jgi:nucleoside-diphosphate-sugar epimerase|nr:NAD-dependent epimerase/dehydratase family protein [Thermoleophilia bacterium]
MSRALVTGAAGFIGHHLCDALLRRGWEVVGLDRLTDFTPREEKRRRVAALSGWDGFRFAHADLVRDRIDRLVAQAAVVFHLAGQPGVRDSYGAGLDRHLRDNVDATRALAESMARAAPPGARLVMAGTSSVYGDAPAPFREDGPTRPRSPYGVTKLAAEGLARALLDRAEVEVVVLRYFTVYGPGQRPDMAFHRFITAALTGEPAPLMGDGRQTRDVTFVADAVAATVAAARRGAGVYNVGGGSPASVLEALEVIAGLAGRPVPVLPGPPARGDVAATLADTGRARRDLGLCARTSLEEGIALQMAAVARSLGRARRTAVRV